MNKDKCVICYLAMNTAKDESYGRDSRSMLIKSLDLLYKNYNNKFHNNIIVFYDSKYPFYEKDQIEIISNRNEIKFIQIPDNIWCPPECVDVSKKNTWIDPKFSIGYRNMMRWYGIKIYSFLHDLGYEYYMRMDDDSLLLSEINYDLFEFMINNNYEYGFRAHVYDHPYVSNDFIEFCQQYIIKKNIQPTFILNNIKKKTISNMKTNNWNIHGYYNNFLISKLSFWLQEKVQDFLIELDNTGCQYTKRWNDLISHAVTIQIFMDRKKVYHFNDWSYEHSTFDKGHNFLDENGILAWGGLFPKIENDGNIRIDEKVNNFLSKHNKYSVNCFQFNNIKNCYNIVQQNIMAGKANLDISLDNNIYYWCICNTIDDVYISIEDYYCSLAKCSDLNILNTKYAFVWHTDKHENSYKGRLYAINIHSYTPFITQCPEVLTFYPNDNKIIYF